MFLMVLFAPHCLRAESAKAVPSAQVDQAVIAALSKDGVSKPSVISHTDLTGLFGTTSQWTLVVAKDGVRQSASDDTEDGAPTFICLVKSAIPDCAQRFYEEGTEAQRLANLPYHFLGSRLVYGGSDRSNPLLLLRVCTSEMFNGNCGVATSLYRYDKVADRFNRVFLIVTGRNNNEETRFVESGPIRGDVVVTYPTQTAPYTYWIEVYRPATTGRYSRILRYRGRTGYSDGNPMAVADSEMPEILRRLGLWKLGDPLPFPVHLPNGCRSVYMQRGEEWCK